MNRLPHTVKQSLGIFFTISNLKNAWLLSSESTNFLQSGKHGFYINTKHIRFKFVITIFLKGLVTIRLGEFHKVLWFPPPPPHPPLSLPQSWLQWYNWHDPKYPPTPPGQMKLYINRSWFTISHTMKIIILNGYLLIITTSW